MDHADHLALIRGGVTGAEGGAWAELGAGRCAFTLALAELLVEGASLVVIDRDGRALNEAVGLVRQRTPDLPLVAQVADFTRPLKLANLNGVLMANSLHFVADKAPLLTDLRTRYLRPGGLLLMVEYDTERGNRWVPYPLSFARWRHLATRSGFAETREIGRRPSHFLGAIFSAVSLT